MYICIYIHICTVYIYINKDKPNFGIKVNIICVKRIS